jgi:hypothetical protein
MVSCFWPEDSPGQKTRDRFELQLRRGAVRLVASPEKSGSDPDFQNSN